MIDRIRSAGSDVAIVSMDEPLASCVVGAERRFPEQVGVDSVGDIARFAANYAQDIHAMGPEVALIEAYPYHPADRLSAFIRHILNAYSLSFVELDIDPFGIRDQGISNRRVRADLMNLKTVCHELDTPFRVIVTALRARNPAEYREQALELAAMLRDVVAPVDGVTVQSWAPEFPDLPRNLPADARDSHLGVLQEVLTLGLYGDTR